MLIQDPSNYATAHLQWLDALVTFALPKTLTFEEAQAEVAEFDNTYLYKDEGDMLQVDVIEDADI